MTVFDASYVEQRRSLNLIGDKFARCLGYDYCCIMSMQNAQYVDEYKKFRTRKRTSRFIVALGYLDRIEYAFMFDEDRKFLCINESSTNKAAKLIYKMLDSGKKLNVMDKQLVGAEDVAKFMIDCVMTGLAQECE